MFSKFSNTWLKIMLLLLRNVSLVGSTWQPGSEQQQYVRLLENRAELSLPLGSLSESQTRLGTRRPWIHSFNSPKPYQVWFRNTRLDHIRYFQNKLEDALVIFISTFSILTIFWILGKRQPPGQDLMTQTSTDFYRPSADFILTSLDFCWLSSDSQQTFYWLHLTFYLLLLTEI